MSFHRNWMELSNLTFTSTLSFVRGSILFIRIKNLEQAGFKPNDIIDLSQNSAKEYNRGRGC